MKKKQFISLALAASVLYGVLSPALCVSAEPAAQISTLSLTLDSLYCGDEIKDGVQSDDSVYISCTVNGEYTSHIAHADTNLVITGFEGDKPLPMTGKIEGEKTYIRYLTIKPEAGYSFAPDLTLEEDMQILSLTADAVTVRADLTAKHNNPYDDSFSQRDATCTAPGETQFTCSGCGKSVTEVLEIDPDAHSWSEWTVDEPASRTHTGHWSRSCTLCNEQEQLEVPMLYTKAYEPETSWAMSATVAWRADGTAADTAAAEVRPAVAFVWVDAELHVYDREKNLLADSVAAYVEQTAATMIPAFYVENAEASAALKAWLEETGFEDCFVVSTPDQKEAVKDTADLLHVRGMIDFTAQTSPDRKALTDMIATVNGAHGKVILLSSEAATRENIRFLQSLCATVWVQSPADTRTILTHYTNGVNGILVDDYQAAIRAQNFFQDDAPSLLRIPQIIGHRGDPSNYAENTLESANGAFEEGADAVENDIYLSADGELFIRHENSLYHFLGKENTEGESLTLAELQAEPFLWSGTTGIPALNEVSNTDTSYGKLFNGKLYGEEEGYAYHIPSLRSYLESFKGKPLVHDTEIKSENPQVVAALKALVDEYDAWDQVFTITFNENILQEIYDHYPEMPVGALWLSLPSNAPYTDAYTAEAITQKAGCPEIPLEMFCAVLDQWNATYNPPAYEFGKDMVKAGRHRGLTVWPWTYTTSAKSILAEDYLYGAHGLTMDEPWFVSDLIVEIPAADIQTNDPATIEKPIGIQQNGAQRPLDTAELVQVEALDTQSNLMMWRYKAEMILDGESFGSYYLYSNPFVVETAAEAAAEPDTATPTATATTQTVRSTTSKNNSSPKVSKSAPKTGELPYAILLCSLLGLGTAGLLTLKRNQKK